MKEIKLEGLNETIYEHTHKSGLKTYMWVNEKVNSCYMTLSVRYGSLHTDFKVGNKRYKVPNGLAHFLEHIKFNESDEVTAHDVFYKLGGDANAFTTYRYTSYLVYTSANIKENLNHLIDFVYNPYFTKKIVQKEKGIITEEANMGSDNAHSLSYYLFLRNMFSTSKYKEFITGNPEEIKEITLDHVLSVYNAFYHPKNSFLCLTGNFNPYEMAKVIDDNMDQKEFPEYIEPIILTEKEPKEVVKEYEELEMNVTSPMVNYGLKIPRNRFKDLDDLSLRMALNLILNNNFGGTSDLKEELLGKGLITGISASSNIFDDYVGIFVKATSEYPEEVIKRIEEQLDNLDVDEKAINRKKKANLASLILDFDDIESVNEMVQDDLILYNEIITDLKKQYIELSIETIQDVAANIDTKNKSIMVVKPKKDKE